MATRGWTPPAVHVPTSEFGSPAHAGMDPNMDRASFAAVRLPRTRGDGPYSLLPAEAKEQNYSLLGPDAPLCAARSEDHIRLLSALFARPKEKVPVSSSLAATARPWRSIWKKNREPLPLMLTPSFSWSKPDGVSRRSFPSQTTSGSCRCRQNHPSSTRRKHLAIHAR
jgi:hypothetical protein